MLTQFRLIKQVVEPDTPPAHVRILVTIAIGAVLATVILVSRIADPADVPYNFLWAEDGKTLLQEASILGPKALITPYQGYLIFYLRLIALIASGFDLIWQPYVMFLGWVIAFCILAIQVIYASRNLGLRPIMGILVLLAITAQPAGGELFFNTTNSQWLIGLTLFLVMLADRTVSQQDGPLRGLGVFLLAITGPFSVVLCPVLVLKMYLLGDLHRRAWSYAACFSGASLQVAMLMTSERVADGALETDIMGWIEPFLRILLFNSDNATDLALVGGLWAMLLYGLVRRGLSEPRALLLVLTALLLVVASLYSAKERPADILAFEPGNRYTFVPFALLFMATLVASADRIVPFVLATGLISALCLTHFRQIDPGDMHFPSYAALSQATDVLIPMNPQWTDFPGWHLFVPHEGEGADLRTYTVDFDEHVIAMANVEVTLQGRALLFEAVGNDPIIEIRLPVDCGAYDHIGVEAVVRRSVGSWAQLFWADRRYFEEVASFRRFYPAGRTTMQFAFENQIGSDIFLRLDPMEETGQGAIERMDVFCLLDQAG